VNKYLHTVASVGFLFTLHVHAVRDVLLAKCLEFKVHIYGCTLNVR